MGRMIDGQWHDHWYDTKATGGRFVRKPTSFRRFVEDDPGAEFAFEPGRYHLFVSYACPWAHRTLIGRTLKGLEDSIAFTAVDPLMLKEGWVFSESHPEPLYGTEKLYELYARADANYNGRVTVPVLWDKKTQTIVNNESSEILRMFDAEFRGSGPVLYPEALRAEIDAVNESVYEPVNNGVYKCGFATTQEAYEEAAHVLFDALDSLEKRLEGHEYLVADTLTEADIRLFTTLVRFDAVYHTHFKCNRVRVQDLPNLWAFTRRIYQLPGVAETVNLAEITRHYYYSHETINPHRIVPLGPEIDFMAPV